MKLRELDVLFISFPVCLSCTCLRDKYVYRCLGGDTSFIPDDQSIPVISIVGNRMVLVDEQSKGLGQGSKHEI